MNEAKKEKTGLYAVKEQQDGLHLYIVRKENDGLFLVEDLVDVMFQIYATGLLTTFDIEEIEAKYLYEMTEDELVEECDLFMFQEAALGHIARELERREKK